MQDESNKPMSPFQALYLGLAIFRILARAHAYVANSWLCYAHGTKWPPFGIKVVAASLPLIHVVGWVIVLGYHPEYGPVDLRPLVLTVYPSIGVMAYRTAWSWFNTTDHSYYSGHPYLAWAFGGSEIAWKVLHGVGLGAAAYLAPWGRPMAVYLGCMGVAELWAISDHFAQVRRRRRAIRDAEIDGNLMMG